MIAGTLALLTETVDDPIENYHDSGFRAIDVDASHEYLDGHRVQTGMVAGRVNTHDDRIYVDGSTIDIETVETRTKVAAEWLADVQQDGWIMTDRTFATQEDHRPDWPFSLFETKLGVEIAPLQFDPKAFVDRQQDAGRTVDIEMTSIGSENTDGNVKIDWGHGATRQRAERANVGFAGSVDWDGTIIRLVIYESGYCAVWSNQTEPVVARFVHEELLPVASVKESDEDESEQARFKNRVGDHLEEQGLEVTR